MPVVGRAAFKIYLRRNSRRILVYRSAINFTDLRLQAGFVLMTVRFFGRASGWIIKRLLWTSRAGSPALGEYDRFAVVRRDKRRRIDEMRVAAVERHPIYKLFRRENFYFWGFLLKINGLNFTQRRIRGALCTACLCPARILAASAQASVA